MNMTYARAMAVAVGVLGLSLVPLLAATSLARPAAQPPPEAEDDIIADIFALSSYTELHAVDDPSDLSLGEYVQLYDVTEGFATGAVTQNLISEFIPIEIWMAPVYHLGEPFGATEVITGGGEWHAVTLRSLPSFATDLEQLQPGERVVVEAPFDYFLLRGDVLTPFDEWTRQGLTTTFTITEYQQYVLDKYRIFRENPELTGGAGGGGPTGRTSLPRPLDLAAVTAALLALVVGVVVLRRRTA